jgi:hypothetical protein
MNSDCIGTPLPYVRGVRRVAECAVGRLRPTGDVNAMSFEGIAGNVSETGRELRRRGMASCPTFRDSLPTIRFVRVHLQTAIDR